MTHKATVRVYEKLDDVRFSSHSAAAEEVVLWLQDDIGRHWSSFERVRKQLGSTAPPAVGYLGTGNAHTVRATDSFLVIENEYVEGHKVLLTRAQLLVAMDLYRECVSTYDKDQTVLMPEFTVEFEEEGAAALQRYIDTGLPLGLRDFELKYD
jgi:hypothetical protein